MGIKDDNNKVIAASLFSKILLGKLCLLFESWSSNGFSDLGLVDYYLKELDKYLQQQNVYMLN